MLEAVIFDLDGVITDSATYHYQAWKEIADRLGIAFTVAYNERLKGVSRIESLNLILDNGKGRAVYSAEEKERLAFEKNENYKQLIKQITADDLLPGIGELLKVLNKKKVRVGLASASRNAMFIIKKLKIDLYFDYIADAEKIKNPKPFPDIFLDCIKNLEVDAINSIGIEDAAAGIEAIHRAGMKAIGVGTAEQMCDADIILEGTNSLTYEMLVELNC